MLSIADASVDKVFTTLVDLVREVMNDRNIHQTRSDVEAPAARVYDALKLLVPAQGIGHLGEIIAGGWKAYRDRDLWKDDAGALARRDEILNELLLKSIEVMEIELLRVSS